MAEFPSSGFVHETAILQGTNGPMISEVILPIGSTISGIQEYQLDTPAGPLLFELPFISSMHKHMNLEEACTKYEKHITDLKDQRQIRINDIVIVTLPIKKADSPILFKFLVGTNIPKDNVFRIAAKVVEIRPNGNLAIEARQTIWKNNEKLVLDLSGSSRPASINPVDKTVSSDAISELKLKSTYISQKPPTNERLS